MDSLFQYEEKYIGNIAQKALSADKYFYSWNIVKDEELYFRQRAQADKYHYKYFCYDHANCSKYDMSFNTIMYDKTLVLPNEQIEYDTIFLGYLKDRKETMLELHNLLQNAGLTAEFVIISHDKERTKEVSSFKYVYERVDYFDYLNMLNKSRSILDIAQEGQDGFSMRVMEAIFLGKKLVTTNRAILGADFYNENNILVVDLENVDANAIVKFFQKEMVDYPDEVKDYYSFEKWIERFC
jgi:hypothetical protein